MTVEESMLAPKKASTATTIPTTMMLVDIADAENSKKEDTINHNPRTPFIQCCHMIFYVYYSSEYDPGRF